MHRARDGRIDRRRFGFAATSALAAFAVGDACASLGSPAAVNDGRLNARPAPNIATSLKSGALGLGSDRDGVIQMPSTPPPGPPGALPLLVFLHGATQSGAGMVRRVGPAADQAGVVVVAPDSRGTTWDAIRGSFADDVEFLDRTLKHVFTHVAVDPARVAIGGFSDGASYALSLGLANGDLFPRVVACSPGFVITATPHGHAAFFVSHGTSDQILPIDQCSRVIVPRLRSMGYDVAFREFDGRHELPPDVANEAMRWLAAV
jgi:phospholipase/carboxylesterase